MRTTHFHRLSYGLLALLIALLPMRSDAVLPLAVLGQQILQNVILGETKDQLFGSLADMGCKGSHLTGILATVDTSKTFNGGIMSPGMPIGMPSGLPSGMSGGMGGNASGGMGMPGMTSSNGTGTMPMTMGGKGSALSHSGMATMTPAQAQAMTANGMPDMGFMSQMTNMPPEQMAQMQQSIAGMQQAMSHPLSRKESLAVFDEMGSLGLMTKDQLSEVHDCIELAPPGSETSIGMAGAMFKNMLLPMLKDTKQKLSNLTPEEQSELTNGMVDALQHASAKDRQAFLDGFGAGFYPASVVAQVRAELGSK